MTTLLGLSIALVLFSSPRTAQAQPPTPTPTPAPPFDPYRRAGAELLLPILNFQGQDDICDSWVDVHNLGADAVKVMLVSWGEPGFCPPQAAGPQKPECSGLLKPGGTWTFSGAMIPTGTRGGVLYRLATTPYSGDFEWLGSPVTTLADAICVLAFFQVIDDGDGWPRFEQAYRRGGVMDGVDLYAAAGTGLLAATVTRRCPGAATPGVDAMASYNGIALNRVGDIDPVEGAYVVHAPDVESGSSIFYAQNAGLRCASVQIWFAARDGCVGARLCAEEALAPLETLNVDASRCGTSGTQGAMWVRSTQPVAVVVDRVAGDRMTTYSGAPSTLLAAHDPKRAAPLPAGPVLSAAYVSNGEGGLGTHVVVMNTNASTTARIRLSLLDPSGALRTSLVDWLCPRGSASYDLAAMGDLPAGWHGAARVVALGGGSASGGHARLAGVARLVGGAAGNRGGDVSYGFAALPEDAAAVRDPSPRLYPGLDAAGTGLIVLPSVRRGPGDSSTTIVVHNAVAAAGYTALRTGLFDANGLVQVHCDTLSAGQQLTIDLDALAYLGAGFRGAAVVSAWYWDHGLLHGDGSRGDGALANPVQLTALALDGHDDVADGPAGDGHGVVSGRAGIPVRRQDVDRVGIDIWWLVAGPCDGEFDAKRPVAGAWTACPRVLANDA